MIRYISNSNPFNFSIMSTISKISLTIVHVVLAIVMVWILMLMVAFTPGHPAAMLYFGGGIDLLFLSFSLYFLFKNEQAYLWIGSVYHLLMLPVLMPLFSETGTMLYFYSLSFNKTGITIGLTDLLPYLTFCSLYMLGAIILVRQWWKFLKRKFL